MIMAHSENNELFCVSTYSTWKSDISSLPLARAGYSYSGRNDEVVCFACKKHFGGLSTIDILQERHRQSSPNCLLVRGDAAGNIALKINCPERKYTTSETTTDNAELDVDCAVLQDNRSDDLMKCYHSALDRARKKGNVSLVRNSEAAAPTSTNQSDGQTPETHQLMKEAAAIRTPGQIQPLTTPTMANVKYPEYAEVTNRIQSFKKGIVSCGQTAEDLADAGWFHIGPGDKVLCFHCGGNLKDWEPEDDPWEEHQKWYPHCAYIKAHRQRPSTQSQPALQVGAVYHPEPREVDARLDTPTVRVILDMGYSRDLVKMAIENRLTTAGDDFPSAESLLEAVFQLEEAGPQRGTPAFGENSNHAAEASSTTSDETQKSGKWKMNKKKKMTSAAATEDDQLAETPVEINIDNERAEWDANFEDIPDKEENRQLREARICKVCMDQEVDTVFLPCGHLVCCSIARHICRIVPFARHSKEGL